MAGTMDPGILRTFVEEVRGYVPAMERELARLRAGGPNAECVEEIHRLAHSIRSASDMIGLGGLAEAARGVEMMTGPEPSPVHGERLARLEREVAAVRLALESPGQARREPVASAAVAPLAFDEIDEEVFGAFSTEAEHLLEEIKSKLNLIATRPGESMPGLRHAVHTLKGAAGMAGLQSVSTLAHRMEDVLDLIEAKVLPAESEVIEVLQSAQELMGDMVASKGLAAAQTETHAVVLERLEILTSLGAESGPMVAHEEPEPALAEVEETDESLIETFLAEAEGHMLVAGDAFRALASAPEDPAPLLAALRRSAHTIKGAAGMVGLMAVSGLAKSMQSLLDAVGDGRKQYSAGMYDLLGESFDLLADLIEARGDNRAHLGRVAEALKNLELAMAEEQREAAPLAVQEPVSRIAKQVQAVAAAEPAADVNAQTVRVPLDRLSGVSRLVGEIFLNASAFEQQIAAFKKELDELTLNLSRMRRISVTLAEEQSQDQSGKAGLGLEAQAAAAEFDVLEFDRYTRMHLLSRDLSEATNDLSSLSTQLNTLRAQLDSWAGRQRGLSSEAQDRLMRMRLVPLSTLANRLNRTVRVSAAKTGKQASLELQGMETEFDKLVAEQLSGPLEHLLRNAVDHGLETAEARVAAGKPQIGVIRLEAQSQGAHLVIRLSDDGAGLDAEKIRRRAVQLGWYTEQAAVALDGDALARLIMEPGFSTAETLSEISGRGVGLDAVRAAVEALRGRLTIQSTPGKGTTFTLLLPVSLAVARTMIVEASGSRFAVPMVTFTRALKVQNSELTVRKGCPGIELAEGWVPVLFLAQWLGLPDDGSGDDKTTLLFVDNGEREIALAVDKVMEAREVVVKPLPSMLKRHSGFAGATILGDGSVVLILNSSSLDPEQVERPAGLAARPARKVAKREVLVVDDSLSIRRSVANLMKASGWVVNTARDGVEALELLEEKLKRPDIVIMDIEMPRMDGFELASRLRSHKQFDTVPIVMLTSRAGEKHRMKASGLGVDGYLVKPCPDDLLLEEVARCLSAARTTRSAT